jgi:two-component system, OmpR family, sensor kinase
VSIRMRLTFWYGALLAVVLLLVGTLSYAFHARGHYDDLDRALVTSAGHAVVEATTLAAEPHLSMGSGDLEVALRLYGADGSLQESSIGDEILRAVDPRAVMDAPAGPAFDILAGLVPPLTGPPPDPGTGAFVVLTTPEQRWRLYVVPLQSQGRTVGYVEAAASLGRLDRSMQRLKIILLAVGLTGLLTALVGSWAVAGRALRPIAHMIETAHDIAFQRDFAQRVILPPERDELSQLADTFNEMLSSLEEAYRAQQRFVADASHELRAPLTAIQGNLELLSQHANMPEVEREAALVEARREAARLTRLVADLLALARADAGMMIELRLVELDTVVLDALHSARQLSRGQQLVLATFEPVQILGNEDRLKQLLLILLDNAIKYTPPDGRVTIELQCTGATAEVKIHDTGVGIPADALPHLFERFYRADPARARDPAGTGLGLPIAKWIVDQHGGSIALTSQPGQGTGVAVTLPISAQAEGQLRTQ